MKTIHKLFSFALLATAMSACDYKDLPELTNEDVSVKTFHPFPNKVEIDSTYTYPGDSLYSEWMKCWDNMAVTRPFSRALSPEDNAFFNKTYIVKSSEPIILYGRNMVYPGSILEGNSISNQQYQPVFLSNRNPITVSATLTHNTYKPTSKTIENPSNSKLSDYVKEIVVDGNFEQSAKFMFQYKRFSFYDELKTAFGTNIDTKRLFSSRKENSIENEEKILKATGMYVKFFQSSFTVNMDIAPLCNGTLTGTTEYEPVYVSSVTYGRLGILVFETNESYEFAESCIKKEFNRIFSKKTETLTTEEQKFFNNTEFKILIIGADSDYAVQSVKGYQAFLNLIYNSTFTEHSYGVPISCTFNYANTHKLVETEFENVVNIEPLFVNVCRTKIQSYSGGENGAYGYLFDCHLKFYKDRTHKITACPAPDICFRVIQRKTNTHYTPVYNKWPMINMKTSYEEIIIDKRNISNETQIYLGRESSSYESTGPTPSSPKEPFYMWEAYEYDSSYNLQSSPFFIIN